MNELFNIASAVLLCIGCFLVLWSTISLARRRFYEPWLDKKQILIALCCFLLAAIIFVPTKSSNRGVMHALSAVSMAISRTNISEDATLKCTVKTTAGTIIANALYEAKKHDTSGKVYFTLKSYENAVFPVNITMFAENIKDTVFNRASENREKDQTSFKLEKGLKSVFAQKGSITMPQNEYAGTGEGFVKDFKANGSVYQWVETYGIDDSGLTYFEIYFNGKSHEGKIVELTYSFELVK